MVLKPAPSIQLVLSESLLKLHGSRSSVMHTVKGGPYQLFLLGDTGILTGSCLICTFSIAKNCKPSSGYLVPSPLQKEHGKCPVGDSGMTARSGDEEPVKIVMKSRLLASPRRGQ